MNGFDVSAAITIRSSLPAIEAEGLGCIQRQEPPYRFSFSFAPASVVAIVAFVMKTILQMLFFSLLVSSGFAQDVYRKIGDRFYDIRQKGWFNSDTFDNPILVSHVVDQVLPDGILVHEIRFNGAVGGSVEDKQCFITNYPALQTASDGQKVH